MNVHIAMLATLELLDMAAMQADPLAATDWINTPC
jgi:hypothetical protein